ncbi:MAG: hypothetical protein IIZ06_02370, partial [Kiritimatiellae bacterium]|nr:hypothetical protein [Kiritimatiellia bacterium]
MKNYLMLFAAAAVAAASMLTAATATADTPSRTVRIAAVNYEGGVVTSVDLAVSAGDESISLYAVHGAADQGADMTAWDSVDSVATVPASESEQIVNYLVSSPHDAFYRFMLATVTPPFKKQLAFLKSDGSQYFILGDKCPNQNWRVAADVSFNYLVSGYTEGFWGARKAARDSSFLCLSQGGTTLRFDMAGGTPTYTGTKDRRYQIDQTNQGVPITWDGGSNTVNVSKDTFTSPCPMGLFAVNSNGSATSLNRGRMTLYSFRVWTNRTDSTSLIYDLIPCVKNDDTVTLYNRVDGSFLSPTGTFTYAEADVVTPTVGDFTVVSVSALLTGNKRIRSSSIAQINGVPTGRVSLTTGFETNTVLVAYGAVDGGDDPAHWDNCAILGDVAPDATSFSSALPFAWSKTACYARFFTASQLDLLGDKVLKSSGTQYIVTDYTANSLTRIRARLAFIDTTSQTVVMWSGRESAGVNTFNTLIDSFGGSYIRFDYKNQTSRMFTTPAEGMELHMVAMGGTLCRLDDESKTITGATVSDFTAGAPLTFFAMNTAGTINYISCVAFAEVKIWSDYADETSLVRHLVPAVRDGKCG